MLRPFSTVAAIAKSDTKSDVLLSMPPPPMPKVFDTDGKEYSADSRAEMYVEDNQVSLEDINPGNSIDVQLVFDVPEDSELDSIQLHSTAISSGVTVSLS